MSSVAAPTRTRKDGGDDRSTQKKQRKVQFRFSHADDARLLTETAAVNPFAAPHGRVAARWTQVAENMGVDVDARRCRERVILLLSQFRERGTDDSRATDSANEGETGSMEQLLADVASLELIKAGNRDDALPPVPEDNERGVIESNRERASRTPERESLERMTPKKRPHTEDIDENSSSRDETKRRNEERRLAMMEKELEISERKLALEERKLQLMEQKQTMEAEEKRLLIEMLRQVLNK
ncbi:hypothetical protein FI667_g2419, partial [Globisporangium splendens]